MRSRRRAVTAAAGLVVVLVVGHLLGFRLLPHHVAAPPDDASAVDVTLTYLEAYDQRDFRLTAALYPSRGGWSRIRPMGRYDDVRPTELLVEDPEGHVAPGPETGQTLVWVMVRYTATGFAESDVAVIDGPGGTGFKLSREDVRHPWRIVDSGTP